MVFRSGFREFFKHFYPSVLHVVERRHRKQLLVVMVIAVYHSQTFFLQTLYCIYLPFIKFAVVRTGGILHNAMNGRGIYYFQLVCRHTVDTNI